MTIYMHQGSNTFDPNKLSKNVAEQWDQWKYTSKMACALWASPFNDKKDNSWEQFWYKELKTVEREALLSASIEIGSQVQFIKDRFCFIKDFHDFYSQPLPLMVKELTDYAKSSQDDHTITKDDLKQWIYDAPRIEKKAQLLIKEQCFQFRENSFYFTVDQDKILQVSTPYDVGDFIKDITPNGVSFKIYALDHEKVRQSGYGGIELYGAETMREHSIFYSWDVDSIAIWDPSCVHIIDREIAALARIAAGASSDMDKYDNTFNVKYLIDWVEQHMEITQRAIDDGIISMEQLANIFSQHSETAGRSNAEKEESQEQKEQTQEQQNIVHYFSR